MQGPEILEWYSYPIACDLHLSTERKYIIMWNCQVGVYTLQPILIIEYKVVTYNYRKLYNIMIVAIPCIIIYYAQYKVVYQYINILIYILCIVKCHCIATYYY